MNMLSVWFSNTFCKSTHSKCCTLWVELICSVWGKKSELATGTLTVSTPEQCLLDLSWWSFFLSYCCTAKDIWSSVLSLTVCRYVSRLQTPITHHSSKDSENPAHTVGSHQQASEMWQVWGQHPKCGLSGWYVTHSVAFCIYILISTFLHYAELLTMWNIYDFLKSYSYLISISYHVT